MSERRLDPHRLLVALRMVEKYNAVVGSLAAFRSLVDDVGTGLNVVNEELKNFILLPFEHFGWNFLC